MENFDKRMAMDTIEDALANIGIGHGRGVATGLCGAFYMCGLLTTEEWEACLKRIPQESDCADGDGIRAATMTATRARNRMPS